MIGVEDTRDLGNSNKTKNELNYKTYGLGRIPVGGAPIHVLVVANPTLGPVEVVQKARRNLYQHFANQILPLAGRPNRVVPHEVKTGAHGQESRQEVVPVHAIVDVKLARVLAPVHPVLGHGTVQKVLHTVDRVLVPTINGTVPHRKQRMLNPLHKIDRMEDVHEKIFQIAKCRKPQLILKDALAVENISVRQTEKNDPYVLRVVIQTPQLKTEMIRNDRVVPIKIDPKVEARSMKIENLRLMIAMVVLIQ